MSCVAIITGSWTDGEQRTARPVNVAPACLACGSYFVDEVEAKIDAGQHISMETAFGDGCDYMMLYSCVVCGFVASGVAVTS